MVATDYVPCSGTAAPTRCVPTSGSARKHSAPRYRTGTPSGRSAPDPPAPAAPSPPAPAFFPRFASPTRNHAASSDSAMWWCHPSQFLTWYSPSPASLLPRFRHSSIRCSAFATRPNSSSGVDRAALERGSSYFHLPPSSYRTTTSISSNPTTLRSTFDSTRRTTISTSRGPFSPSRTVRWVHAPAGSDAPQTRTPWNGGLGWGPRPPYGGGSASRSRIVVFDGTANK